MTDNLAKVIDLRERLKTQAEVAIWEQNQLAMMVEEVTKTNAKLVDLVSEKERVIDELRNKLESSYLGHTRIPKKLLTLPAKGAPRGLHIWWILYCFACEIVVGDVAKSQTYLQCVGQKRSYSQTFLRDVNGHKFDSSLMLSPVELAKILAELGLKSEGYPSTQNCQTAASKQAEYGRLEDFAVLLKCGGTNKRHYYAVKRLYE
jgi:hypothetical protein